MYSLEKLALDHGCKPPFWRRLRKVAVQFEFDEAAERYEQRFRLAVAKRSENPDQA